MYEDPNEDSPDEIPTERTASPDTRAQEKADEFKMHAELAAVYEGPRKFDAQILPGLDASLAREIQQTIGRLANAKLAETPILEPEFMPAAAALLTTPGTHNLSTNDYHIHRRPGEVMIIRFLAADQVDTFYTRLQAHFDAALDGYKEDLRQAHAWKNDPATTAYLAALDKLQPKLADWYLRDTIRQHHISVLSTQAADEINIAYLADQLMATTPATLVGQASAPPEDAPTDKDLAWFFKLFALRGLVDNAERMCFFTYLQKSDDSSW
jgi:hypothetical protein